jgi:hypothetical protein
MVTRSAHDPQGEPMSRVPSRPCYRPRPSRPPGGRRSGGWVRSVGSRPTAGRNISGVERSQGRWRAGAARAGSALEKRAGLSKNERRPRSGSPAPLGRPDPPVPRPAAGPSDPGRPDPTPAPSAPRFTAGRRGDPAAGRGEAGRAGRHQDGSLRHRCRLDFSPLFFDGLKCLRKNLWLLANPCRGWSLQPRGPALCGGPYPPGLNGFTSRGGSTGVVPSGAGT